jgi:pyruvate dehydrogenase E2 component (dihydrolipoamide acetyltransferase)
MASEVKIPRLGQGMESGTIVRWLKAEGDTVQAGEPLYELDTDKVTQEVEAEASGVLLKIAVTAGEVPVGQVVGVIGAEGEVVDVVAAGPEKPAPPAAAAPAPSTPVVELPTAAVAAANDGGRLKASPLARRIARERGVDLAAVRGTGPDGRIVAEDVERAQTQGGAAMPPAAVVAAAPVALPVGEIEQAGLSSIRKTIARRLTEAWTVPAFQLTISADMERAEALVARSRQLDPEVRVTVTDVLTKLCAQALVRHADVNVQFAGDSILRFPTANIGIAVAAPQGLVVPVIGSAERLSLAEIAGARGAIVDKARSNKLTQADLEGGTFTISNLGMFGVEQFIAVLNPPQAAILAVGATEQRPVVRDGQIVARPMVTLTLTVDHRAVDGAQAAAFLQTLKAFVEDPALAL